MGIEHQYAQRRLRNTHANAKHNADAGDYTNTLFDDAYAYTNARNHTYPYACHHAYPATGDYANPNSGQYADASGTDSDSRFNTDTKPQSGPTGAAQQPLDSDASADW